MDRLDFFRGIKTNGDATEVNVAAGDDSGECLIQIGAEGNYTCAYLDDKGVRLLVGALQAFLKAKK